MALAMIKLCNSVNHITKLLQSDAEKLEGLPVAPFMDREKVTKPSAQVGFIKFVLIPLYEALASMFEEIRVSSYYMRTSLHYVIVLNGHYQMILLSLIIIEILSENVFTVSILFLRLLEF